jgi:hypothetical protein
LLTSTDSFVAVTSLIEGEASVLMIAVTGRSQGAEPHEFNWSAAMPALWDATFESIDAAAAPFVTAVQVLPYALGTDYLFQGWLRNGQSYVSWHSNSATRVHIRAQLWRESKHLWLFPDSRRKPA